MHWEQVDKGRAIRKGDRGKGSHVAQVINLDEGIGEIMATSRKGEQQRESRGTKMTLNWSRWCRKSCQMFGDPVHRWHGQVRRRRRSLCAVRCGDRARAHDHRQMHRARWSAKRRDG